jgi:DNA-binding transcriptional LysR family regulator
MLLSPEIESFLVVARCQSLKDASKQLFISVPALSHQMKKLEYKVGVPLFARYNRGMTLTPSGKLFAEKMEQAKKLGEEALLPAQCAKR